MPIVKQIFESEAFARDSKTINRATARSVVLIERRETDGLMSVITYPMCTRAEK